MPLALPAHLSWSSVVPLEATSNRDILDHHFDYPLWMPSDEFDKTESMLTNLDAAAFHALCHNTAATPTPYFHQEQQMNYAPQLDIKPSSPWKEGVLGVSPFNLEPETMRQQLQTMQHIDMLANFIQTPPLPTSCFDAAHTLGANPKAPSSQLLSGDQELDYFSSNLWRRRYAARTLSSIQNDESIGSSSTPSTSSHCRSDSYYTNTSDARMSAAPSIASFHTSPIMARDRTPVIGAKVPAHHLQKPKESIQVRRQRRNASKEVVSPVSDSSSPPGSKRYLCPVSTCDRNFSTSGHAQRHSRIHSGIRPFKCPHKDCHTTFTRSDNCLQHQRSLHKGLTKPVILS